MKKIIIISMLWSLCSIFANADEVKIPWNFGSAQDAASCVVSMNETTFESFEDELVHYNCSNRIEAFLIRQDIKQYKALEVLDANKDEMIAELTKKLEELYNTLD